MQLQLDFLYERNASAFGRSWEEWAAIWCKWLFSIPKIRNPSIDRHGNKCCVNQNDDHVWFLTGSFGNFELIRRKCIIPSHKAIFLPILVKEDSFEEDQDLKRESDLIDRAQDATNRLIKMQASIDGHKLTHLERYRVRSKIFNLTFPDGNVYDVRPGLTRSVCDGYWLFIKPLQTGNHQIYFKGETYLDQFTLDHLINSKVYKPSWQQLAKDSIFRVEVLYDLTIANREGIPPYQ